MLRCPAVILAVSTVLLAAPAGGPTAPAAAPSAESWSEHAAAASAIAVRTAFAHPASSAQATGVPPRADELHWAMRIGGRVAAVEAAFPIVDRVVLTPDVATYLDEIARWSPQGRWPVLLEDALLAPMFVRAFKPAQLLRRPSVGGTAPRGDALRVAVARAVCAAWGGACDVDEVGDDLPAQASAAMREAFSRLGHVPVGLVIASPGDEAWTAAVALAAGRGEPIAWLDVGMGGANDTLPAGRAATAQRAVEEALDRLGRPWRALGDEIETITICRTMAGRIAVEAAATTGSGAPGRESKGTVAATDFYGRLPDGQRGVFAGWIPGDAAAAAFAAMSSLFLPRDEAILVSAYGDGEPWRGYDPAPAADALRTGGFAVEVESGRSADARSWRRRAERGWSVDLAFVNSSGNADFFNMSGNERLSALDVPVLDEPAAIYFVHSWSLAAPRRAATVGGRFLARGAYAYVGSVEEPYLHAFVPPATVATRLLAGVPLLVAARHWEGPLSGAWRVQTIGDPLMIIPAPSRDPRRRVPPTPWPPSASPARPGDAGAGADDPAETAVDLREEVKELMRLAAAERRADAAADALRILDMLGEDAVAGRLWSACLAGGFASPEAAEAALPALFRIGDAEAFLGCWQECLPTQPWLQDMLWHLVGGRLSHSSPEEVWVVLEQSMRKPLEVDAARLYRLTFSLRGQQQASALLDRAMSRMPDDAARKRLQSAVR